MKQALINYIMEQKVQRAEEKYGGLKCDYSDSIRCRIPTLVNWCLVAILIIGLILISVLIYRKHKREEGLWKKILKWDFVLCLIVFILWFLFSLVVRFIGPSCVGCGMI